MPWCASREVDENEILVVDVGLPPPHTSLARNFSKDGRTELTKSVQNSPHAEEPTWACLTYSCWSTPWGAVSAGLRTLVNLSEDLKIGNVLLHLSLVSAGLGARTNFHQVILRLRRAETGVSSSRGV